MLSLSYGIGKLASFEQATQNRSSFEYKLYHMYNEYIHLLFINKKIQSEDDYQIFNTKAMFPSRPADECITNQENRDSQLNKLSNRLNESISKIIDCEMIIQERSTKLGNGNLLKILKDVVVNAKDIDFQESKNLIYEGISASDVMPSQVALPDQYDATSAGVHKGAIEDAQKGVEPSTAKDDYSDGSVAEVRTGTKGQMMMRYGTHLIKTFKDDVNQIIHEESREESMSVSMRNSSKVREDYNSNSIDTKSKYNSQSRRSVQPANPALKSHKHTPEKMESEKIFEIQDNDSFRLNRKKFEDSIESSM